MAVNIDISENDKLVALFKIYTNGEWNNKQSQYTIRLVLLLCDYVRRKVCLILIRDTFNCSGE